MLPRSSPDRDEDVMPDRKDKAARLVEAYASVDRESATPNPRDPSPRILCASVILERSPALRELFTMTLNTEVILRQSECEALVAIRKRRLQWYNAIFHALFRMEYGKYDIYALLRYWTSGIVVYALRAMTRALDTLGRTDLALAHAAELRDGLRRLPRLAAFLIGSSFANQKVTESYTFHTPSRSSNSGVHGEPNDGEASGKVGESEIDDIVRSAASETLSAHAERHTSAFTSFISAKSCEAAPGGLGSSESGQSGNILCRLLLAALQRRREWRLAPHRMGLPEPLAQREAPGILCELISLSAGTEKRLAEERVARTVLQSVAEGCRRHYPRQALLSYLHETTTTTASTLPTPSFPPITVYSTRHNNNNHNATSSGVSRMTGEVDPRDFVAAQLPGFWRGELSTVTPLLSVDAGWVSAVLARLLLLWDPTNPSEAHEVIDCCSGGSVLFLSRILQKVLRPSFEVLLDWEVSIGSSGDAARRGAITAISKVLNGVSALELLPRRKFRFWSQVAVGPPPATSLPRDLGLATAANACREILEERLHSAISYFLGDANGSHHESAQWAQLLRYLIRAEGDFVRLCNTPLGSCLSEATASSPACFYAAVETALTRRRQSRHDVDTLVDGLVEAVHLHFLGPATGPSGTHYSVLPQLHFHHNTNTDDSHSKGSGVHDHSTPTDSVSSGEDREALLRSSLRLARSVSSKDRLLRLYKELLAHRLLLQAVRVQQSPGTAADTQWEDQLLLERSMCAYLQELLPREREETRQMLQMCDDVVSSCLTAPDTPFSGDAAGVRLAVRVLTRLVWPSFPPLPDSSIPPPLREPLSHFATAYAAQHRHRRLVWLRTGRETVVFVVAYPRGPKRLIASLELCSVFVALGAAGAAGLTWHALAAAVGREPSGLERELRRLMSDGFFTPPEGEAGLRINADFTARQGQFRLLQPPPRVATLTKAGGRMAEEVQQARIATAQAAIVKQMKSMRACVYDELFERTQQAIGQFRLEAGVFKTALERLLEKDYIERDPTQKQKFLYKA